MGCRHGRINKNVCRASFKLAFASSGNDREQEINELRQVEP